MLLRKVDKTKLREEKLKATRDNFKLIFQLFDDFMIAILIDVSLII